MEAVELGLLPFTCLLLAVLTPVLSITVGKKVGDVVAIIGSLIVMVMISRLFFIVNNTEIAIYGFGGFPPPLGIIYIADGLSVILAMLVSYALFISILHTICFMHKELRPFFYTLAYLLITGVYGCLFTGDIFNLYVSVELVAISSYILTGFYRKKRSIRAALIYGISGTVITSFLLLSTFIVYGAYGTMNMMDIAIKTRIPEAVVPFSGGIVGDIILASSVTLTLTTWVFLFKSGIIPVHFWLPEAYTTAPISAIFLFTAAADIIGVYSLLRIYHIVFPGDGVISSYREFLLRVLLVIGTASAIISSVLVAKQTTVRRLVAYSSIAQFSLALLGIVTENSEGIAGSVLHIVANGLGDIAVLCSVSTLYYMLGASSNLGRRILMLSRFALVLGLLNLFGIIPLLPGFWSKAFLTTGFIHADILMGAATVLISSGLCALGYLRFAMRFITVKHMDKTYVERRSTKLGAILMFTLILIIFAILGLGITLLISNEVRNTIITYVYKLINAQKYIKEVMPIS